MFCKQCHGTSFKILKPNPPYLFLHNFSHFFHQIFLHLCPNKTGSTLSRAPNCLGNNFRKLLVQEEDSSWWANLVQEVKMGLMQFRTWEVSHTRNEANNAAHILARHAQGIDDCEAWLEDVPCFLSKQL